MELKDFGFDNSSGFLTYTAGRLLTLELSRNLDSTIFNITAEQYRVLYKIWELKRPTQKILSDILYQDKSTISRLISHLLDKGFIERQFLTNSAKAYVVQITPSGIECLTECVQQAQKTIDKAMLGLNKEEVEFLKTLLKRVIKNIAL